MSLDGIKALLTERAFSELRSSSQDLPPDRLLPPGYSAGVRVTPPSVAPLNATLTARPRRRSNHGAGMMFTAAPLIAP